MVKLLILKQQQNKNPCLNLSDFVDGNNDNISTYCCVFDIGSISIHRYFSYKNSSNIPLLLKQFVMFSWIMFKDHLRYNKIPCFELIHVNIHIVLLKEKEPVLDQHQVVPLLQIIGLNTIYLE